MAFGDYLRAAMAARGLSFRQLGEMSGVDHSYLSRCANGIYSPPSPRILKKIFPYLGVSYERLMFEAGHLPPPTLPPNLRELSAKIGDRKLLEDDTPLSEEERAYWDRLVDTLQIAFRKRERGELSARQIRQLVRVVEVLVAEENVG